MGWPAERSQLPRRAPLTASGVRWALLGLAFLGGCATISPTPPEVLARLRETPGAYLRGTVEALTDARVLDDSAFAYAVAFAPDGRSVAFTLLHAREVQLALFDLGGPSPVTRWAVPINPSAYDVEGLAFSPDGTRLATGGRDGALRLFDAATGARLAELKTPEALVSLAFHPAGALLVTGGAKGFLSAYRVPGLERVGEVRGHDAEVRAVAFSGAGALFSGGWDSAVARWTLSERASDLGGAAPHVELSREARRTFEGFVEDLDLDAAGAQLAVALSRERALRTPEGYAREKRGELPADSPLDRAELLDAQSLAPRAPALRGHRGVVSTVALSPDGQTLVSGGWDSTLTVGGAARLAPLRLGWLVRRARFCADGTHLAVAAWKPPSVAASPTAEVLVARVPGAVVALPPGR